MNSKKLILSGIIPIFILGSITHFAYDWCSITLLGLVAPINSSIWEHMKMGLLPTIIWWGLTYLLFKDKLKLDFKRYFVAFTVSLLVSTFLMPFLYYTYRYGLGVHLLIVDILNLLCTVTMGQLLALHIYNHYSWKKIYFNLCVIVLILVVLYLLLTHLIFLYSRIMILVLMEYIIDDKGNNLKFVINKKIHCQKTRQCIFNILP